MPDRNQEFNESTGGNEIFKENYGDVYASSNSVSGRSGRYDSEAGGWKAYGNTRQSDDV